MIRESAFSQSETGILGIISHADATSDVALVMPNAGFIHRAGPFRLHVALARRAAQRGITTLRLDQPGVGDAIATASRPQLDLASDVLDEAERLTGASQFIVGGICSAADLGWQLALRDSRVGGLLLIDPMARRDSAWFRWGQLHLALARGPAFWFAWLGRRWTQRGSAEHHDAEALRDWPAVGDAAGQLHALVARGVKVLAIYTGGAAPYMTHRRQFAATYGPAAADPQVQVEHWPECDHLFFLPEHRERLIQRVETWLQTDFGAAA